MIHEPSPEPGPLPSSEVQQMLRDRLTFAMAVGVPVMQLILFGYAINTDPKGPAHGRGGARTAGPADAQPVEHAADQRLLPRRRHGPR